MEVFICTLERILLLFMFILAGYLLVKFRALPKNSADVLAKLENNLFIPCLVLSTFAGNFTVAKISEAWKLFLLGMAVSIIMIVIAKLFTPLISKDRFTQNIYTYGLVFSNFGFMGNAIVCAVFPDVFLEYLIFTLPMWTLIYIWGVPFLLIPRAEGESVSIKKQLGKFINPMFVSMLIGMILGLTELDLPSFLSASIDMAGECMSPVSMILTGVIVAGMQLGRVLRQASIYIMTAIRLVLLPLIGIALFCILPVPEAYYTCTVCALAMPLGLNIMVIPSGYGKDTSLAAAAIIISHLASAVTIPLVFMLMEYLIG